MTKLRTVVSLVVLLLLVAACGNGGGADEPDATEAPATTETANGEDAPPATGGGDEPAAEPQTITWASTGGAFTEAEIAAVQEPFTEATGHTFENISPAELAQIRAMVDADRVTWDMVTMPWHFGELHCGELYEPLDEQYFDFSLYQEGSYGECYAPIGLPSWIFSYNADSYPDEAPSSIADFFDVERFPGQRVILDSPHNVLEAALVADGVDPSELYPLDIERALAKFEEIRDHLTLAPTYGAVEQALVGGQADMTITVTARTVAIADQGVPLEPVWDFTMAGKTVQMVVKDAPNADLAQQVISFAHEPEQAIAYAEQTGLYPARTDVSPEDIDFTETQHKFNAFAEGRGTIVQQNPEWYSEQIDQAIEAWTEWAVGG